jgi:hypothetical protein
MSAALVDLAMSDWSWLVLSLGIAAAGMVVGAAFRRLQRNPGTASGSTRLGRLDTTVQVNQQLQALIADTEARLAAVEHHSRLVVLCAMYADGQRWAAERGLPREWTEIVTVGSPSRLGPQHRGLRYVVVTPPGRIQLPASGQPWTEALQSAARYGMIPLNPEVTPGYPAATVLRQVELRIDEPSSGLRYARTPNTLLRFLQDIPPPDMIMRSVKNNPPPDDENADSGGAVR